jgi:hypothetical protein
VICCQCSQVVERIADIRVYGGQEVWRSGSALPVVLAKVEVSTFDGQVSQMSDDGPFGAGQLKLLAVPQLGQELCIILCQRRFRNFDSHLAEPLRSGRRIVFMVFVFFVVIRKRFVNTG